MARDFALPGRSPVRGVNGMAATSMPQSTLAALDVLRAGGNALDAAVAAVAVQCVIEPQSTGIGGDCFCLYAPAGASKPFAINGSGRAPAAATIDWFESQGISAMENTSPHAVTIPGAVGAWEALLKKYGTKGFDELLRPAIAYAENGFVVHDRTGNDWEGSLGKLSKNAASARHFLVDGRTPRAGEIFRQPALAATLSAIAKGGARAFYEGAIAADMVKTLRALGGLHTEADFAANAPEFVDPIRGPYRGMEIFQCPPNGSGLLVLMLVVLGSWTIRQRLLVRWLAAIAVAGTLYAPSGIIRQINASKQVVSRQISPKDAGGCLNRDIATLLRASQPEGEITMLASPNASTGIGYYGRFKTLGTLYWENSEGLKAAARIYSAKSEQEAADLILKHKVTHIALVFEENFIEQYYRLINPGSQAADVKQSFGYRLFQEKVVPQWLQMIPYKVPDDLASLKPGVMLFKVNFKQTMPEALFWVFKSQLAVDAVPEAERTLDRILAEWPNFYEPWIEKAKLLAGRKAWQESAQTWLKGIGQAGPEIRPALFAEAASTFFNSGEHAMAIEIYRIALKNSPTADLTSYLAWVLATSKQDKLRNGPEALELCQQLLKTQPTPSAYYSVLSAAFAEVGRMPEAVNAAEQALANAIQRKEPAAELFAQRLAVLKSGQPLRN